MPRSAARRQVLTFVGGLNTEASPLTFPENTAKAIDNVDLSRDGSIRRRRGLDYESSYMYSIDTFNATSLGDLAISVHEWKSVGGDDNLNFLVVQVGGTLYFHNLGDDSLSVNPIGSMDFGDVLTRNDFDEHPIRTAAAKGKLFIVGRGISPFYVQYVEDTNDFQGVKLSIKIRDTDGIDEEEDSPIIFEEDEITPPSGVDPINDIQDVSNPLPEDFTFYFSPFVV